MKTKKLKSHFFYILYVPTTIPHRSSLYIIEHTNTGVLTGFLPTGVGVCRVISRLVLLSQPLLGVARGILGTPALPKDDPLTAGAWWLAKLLLLLTKGALTGAWLT